MDGWMDKIDSNREQDSGKGLTASFNRREHSCVT